MGARHVAGTGCGGLLPAAQRGGGPSHRPGLPAREPGGGAGGEVERAAAVSLDLCLFWHWSCWSLIGPGSSGHCAAARTFSPCAFLLGGCACCSALGLAAMTCLWTCLGGGRAGWSSSCVSARSVGLVRCVMSSIWSLSALPCGPCAGGGHTCLRGAPRCSSLCGRPILSALLSSFLRVGQCCSM